MKYGLPGFVKELDLFGQPVPAFNISGKTQVKTAVGSIFSICLLSLTFAFGLIKLQAMIDRKNPQITTNTVDLETGESYSLA